jgi:hypothetical protein
MKAFVVSTKIPKVQDAINDIGAFDGRARLRIEKAVSDSTLNIKQGAIERVRVRKGSLRKSIKSSFRASGPSGTVYSKRPTAHLIELGVKPHKISARGKTALVINGDFVRKGVSHPGFTAKPFLRPAYEDEKPRFIRKVEEAVKADD